MGILFVFKHDQFVTWVFFTLEAEPVAFLTSAVEHLTVGTPMNLQRAPTALTPDFFWFDLSTRGFRDFLCYASLEFSVSVRSQVDVAFAAVEPTHSSQAFFVWFQFWFLSFFFEV